MLKAKLKIRCENFQIASRFMSKVELSIDRFYKGTPCWIWQGFLNPSGYGTFWFVDSNRLSHRISYKLFVGDIPIPGSVKDPSDHLCRNHSCVNPAHQERVTPRINALRGIGPTAINAKKTHCGKGHEFTPENTKLAPSGSRICLTCLKGWSRTSRKRNAAKRAEYNRQWLKDHPDKAKTYKTKYSGRYKEKRKLINKAYRERKAKENLAASPI
jgi:hypothetical protein